MANYNWAERGRDQLDRSKLKYPSNLTDGEWALVEGLIPPAKRGGNKRTLDVRQVLDGLMYVLCTGCQWTAIPKDLPPRTTLNDYFRRWQYDGTLARIHQAICGTGQLAAVVEISSASRMIAGKAVNVSDAWRPGLDRGASRPETNQQLGAGASW